MQLRTFDRVEEFLAVAGDRLLGNEAEEGLSLGVVLRAQRGRAYGEGPVFLGCVLDAGKAVGTAIRTPRYGLILSIDEGAEGACALVAEHLAEGAVDLPSVHGRAGSARRFAERWCALTGRAACAGAAHRLYLLTQVRPPQGVPGRLRPAQPRDIDWLAAWAGAFHDEAVPDDLPQDARALVEGHVVRGALFVWDNGGAVSMAAATRPTPHGISVNLVYTPPSLRGRGYASACVAALSQAQLDAGKQFCTLFADVANPISNRIYQRIGYRPVGDFALVRFIGPAAARDGASAGSWVSRRRSAGAGSLRSTPRASFCATGPA